jgi:hypothetical protein
MKTRILGLMVGASAVAMSFVSCSQPPIDCRVAHSGATGYNYAAVYTPTAGSGVCAEIGGDQLGMETYHDVAKNNDTEKQDFEKPAKVAIQSMYLGVLSEDREDLGLPFDEDPNHKRYAYGEFDSTTPDEKDICTIKSLKPAEQLLPEIPAELCDPADCPACTTDDDCADTDYPVCDTASSTCTIPVVPEQHVKYEWTDINVYVTAASGGAQVQAHLKYTEDGCTAEYDVTAVWPAINCTGADEEGNFIPDETLCCPEGDITRGRGLGSGISPDFPVKCVDIGGFDYDYGLPNFVCVLDMSYSKDGKIPVIKEDWAKDKAKAPACQPLPTSATEE